MTAACWCWLLLVESPGESLTVGRRQQFGMTPVVPKAKDVTAARVTGHSRVSSQCLIIGSLDRYPTYQPARGDKSTAAQE
jgi:hypothetical protein